jgi:ankyrin repeat protein
MSIEAKEFIEAIKEGQAEKVEQLLEQSPALLQAKDENGVSAILWAVYRGHKELAQRLVDKGYELDIFESAALGHEQALDRLLKENKELAREFSKDGFTALGLTCFFGNVQAMKLLLAAGSDPNVVSRNQMKVTPLHSAVAHRNGPVALTMTRMLLEREAEVNVAQEGGWTPLHQAAAHGQTDIIELLLERGARLDAVSGDGRTPLRMAEEGKHHKAVELLQKHAAGV